MLRKLFFVLLVASALIGCSQQGAETGKSGENQYSPALSWDYQSHDFEDTFLGEAKVKTITLKNTGLGPSKPIMLNWLNKNQSSWKIVPGQDYCTNKVLLAGESCTVSVMYSPAVENSDSNVLMAADNSGAQSSIEIEGRGIASVDSLESFELNKNSISFSETQIGVLKRETIILRNSGTKKLNSVQITSNDESFKIENNSCLNKQIMPNQSCFFTVIFSPWSIGDHQGIVEVSSLTKTESVAVSGIAKVSKAVLEVNPSQYSPSIVRGVSQDQIFTLKNTGEGVSSLVDLSFSSGINFDIKNDNCSNTQLKVGEECSFTLKNLALWTTMTDSLSIKGGRNNLTVSLTPVLNTEMTGSTSPMASEYSYTMEEEGTLIDGLRASDPNNLSLSYQIVSNPTKGSVVVSSEGIFTYNPNENEIGSDSFSYKVINSNGEESEVKTISITIENKADDLSVDSYAVQVNENESTTFSLDSTYVYDPEGGYIFITSVKQPSNGTIKLNPDNTFTYTPNADYVGADSFLYYVSSGGTQVEGTLNLQVNNVNNAPVSDNKVISTDEDTPLAITLTATDADGETLTYTVVSGPTNGILSGTIPNLVYTPNTDYNGADSFTYKTNDGEDDSNIATVAITVNPINDLPIADNKNVNTLEDTPVEITLTSSDVDGDTLTYTVVSGPANGTLSGTVPNLTYTPNADYMGSDSFTYKVNDGTGDSNIATVAITVNPVNDAPSSYDDTVITNEDTPVSITLTGTDPDGDSLTYTVVSGPTNGILSGTEPNLIYTPNADYNGSDSFTYKVNDGTTDSNIATVSITVNPVNDAPVVDGQVVNTTEDTPVSITMTASDVDGDTLTWSLVSSPTNGTLSGTLPNIVYTPDLDYVGSDSFSVKVNDGTVDSVVEVIAINVSGENDLPTTQDLSFSTNEDVVLNENLVGSDVDGDTLTYSIVSNSTNGTVSLNPVTGEFSYTPNLNYNGADSFTYKVNDGVGDSNISTVSITVNPINDNPVADDQIVNTLEDTPVAISLTGSDVDGDSLTYTVVSGPTNGVLSGTVPNLTYTPNSNYNGADSFTFKVNDGTVDSSLATVSITVGPVNDLPVAYDDTVITNEDTPVAITLTGSDADGDSLNYTVVSGPTNGTLSGTAPNLTYTPNSNYNGADSFTFKVNDGTTDSNVATVSITVNPVNDTPIADDQLVTTAEENPVSITLTGSDVDGDSLTYTVVSGPTNGVLTGTVPNLTYTPNSDYSGSDSFTFKVNDGTVDSSLATVSITVNPVNDTPIALAGTTSTDEDTVLSSTLSATDADGDALTYSVVSQGSLGTVVITDPSTGAYTYTPNLHANGLDTFTFRVNDGTTNSNVAAVQVTVNPIDDPTVAHDKALTVNENSSGTVTLTVDEVDGDSLTWTIVSLPSNGSLSGTIPNVTYTPNNNYNGVDSFTYKVNDGISDSNVATVSITVNPVNSPPVAGNAGTPVTEDTPKNMSSWFPNLASDPENDPLTWTITKQPEYGTLSGTAPNLTYTPDDNYNGSDSFEYKVNDGEYDSNIGVITFTVAAVNDVPLAQDDSIVLDAGDSTSGTLYGYDVEGDSLTFEIVSSPGAGTLNLTNSSTGAFSYSTTVSDAGNYSFTYRISDGTGYSETKTISITVNAVDIAPRDYTKLIIVDKDEVDADLTNFPIMYNLEFLGDNFWNNVQADGGDLVLTSVDNLTRYSIELVDFNKTTRTGTIFAKVNLSSSVDSKFNLKYNDSATAAVSLPGATEPYGRNSVWSNGYVAVWHMGESSGTLYDSTSNGNNLTKRGGAVHSQASSPHQNNSIRFNSDDGHDDLYTKSDTTGSSLDLFSQFTIEAWVRPKASEHNMRILQKRSGLYDTPYGLYVDYDKAELNMWSSGSVSTRLKSTNSVVFDSWNYLATTFHNSGNRGRVYLNGELDAESTSLYEDPVINNEILEIGGVYTRGKRGFKGNIDEVRLSNVERSAAWIKANYVMTQNPRAFYKETESETLVYLQEFITADSNNLPTGWTTVENNSYDLRVDNQSIIFNGDNSVANPKGRYNFTRYSSGTVNINFDLLLLNHGGELYYDYMMQVGDSFKTNNVNNYTDGVGANLMVASIDHGMASAEGFGTLLDGTVSQLFQLPYNWVNVSITIDIDNQRYKYLAKGYESGWIDFEDLSVTSIDQIRFFANELSGGNVEVRVDNVVIKRQ